MSHEWLKYHSTSSYCCIHLYLKVSLFMLRLQAFLTYTQCKIDNFLVIKFLIVEFFSHCKVILVTQKEFYNIAKSWLYFTLTGVIPLMFFNSLTINSNSSNSIWLIIWSGNDIFLSKLLSSSLPSSSAVIYIYWAY